MNNSTERYTAWQIRTIFFIMAVVLSFTWTTNAHAETNPSSQLSIASNGYVIVKDGTVTSVYGDVITVRSSWGAVTMHWIVNTTGSTRFQPSASSTADALKKIKIGDTVSFSGEIDQTATALTVIASTIKNTSVQRDSVTTRGAVISVDTRGNSFTLSGATGTTTVNVGGGTIMTLDGNGASISDLPIGSDVQVIGSMNMSTNTVQAQRISWQTPSKSVTEARQGVISGFFSWLLGSRGALSILGK